jgi:hypothetical protein
MLPGCGMNADDTLIRAAQGMIRNHGLEAERRAEERAERLKRDSPESAGYWYEVARVVRSLRTRGWSDG